MPFGLHSAPATFQHLMDRVIGPELDPYCFAYLDDIVVLGETFEQHLKVLQEVFRRLRAANLRLNPDKCQFGRRSLTYLCHVVTAAGIRTDPGKVAAIRQLATPKTLRQLRRFLGMASWYRRFISDFSRIAAPLKRLLKKGGRWEWTPEQDAAFNTLKDSLSAAPVLACPDFGKPFVLQTDAADTGLGVALTQYVDGGDYVIAYASRSLTKPEQAYSTTEKECVVWGIEKMRPYLEGYRFSVLTDHQSLKWLQAIKNPAGRLAQWAIFLQQHDFDIRYRKGALNRVADTLSRQLAATEDETTPEDLFALEDAPGGNWYNRMRQEVQVQVQEDAADYPGREEKGTRNPKEVRNPPTPPQTGPTASGENPLLPQTRPAASICWIDGSDRRALPRLIGESRAHGTPMDLTVRRRRHDPTPPLPLPRVPDRSPLPGNSPPPATDARAHSDSYPHSASSSASELTPTATPLPTLLTSRSLPPWPVPSHCEGTPAIPLSPFPSWPVPSHCEGTSAFPLSPCLPGPFLPIATEPRPSRFLLFFLARSLPLRGNPGLPGFSLRPGSFLPAVREPRPSRFPFTLLSFAPNRKSQQRPGPTGTTVSMSRALLRHPPGTLLQVTDTVPERFRRH
jgi:hypothetical protein